MRLTVKPFDRRGRLSYNLHFLLLFPNNHYVSSCLTIEHRARVMTDADLPKLPATSPDSQALQQRWIRINTGVLASNVRAIRTFLAKRKNPPKLMAVVKADAYGHGAAGVAPFLRDAGAGAFGVTTLDEAIEIADAGIDSRETPILLFAPLVTSEQVEFAVSQNFHLTIADSDHLTLAEAAESRLGVNANLHIKVDTGMGRLGLGIDDAVALATSRLNSKWAGAYTHFANAAEKSLNRTRRQRNDFKTFCEMVNAAGVTVGVAHHSNSAAALRFTSELGDMVRIGTAIYGQLPSKYVPKPPGLSADTFTVQARVIFTRDIKPGDTVGYGSEFVAKRPTKTAVLPIGFADGFTMSPASLYQGWRGIKQILAQRDPNKRPFVTIRGQRASVLGRVAMQMIVVDVTDFSDPVKTGEIADIPMRRLAASAWIPRRYE